MPTVTNDNGAIRIRAKELRGAKIYLDVVSVGATINIMLAASRAKGTTHDRKRGEVSRKSSTSRRCSVRWARASKERDRRRSASKGSERLHGCRHSIIPDRIQAGTYMIAAAATRGDVIVDNVIPKHMEAVTAKLQEMGAHVDEMDEVDPRRRPAALLAMSTSKRLSTRDSPPICNLR